MIIFISGAGHRAAQTKKKKARMRGSQEQIRVPLNFGQGDHAFNLPGNSSCLFLPLVLVVYHLSAPRTEHLPGHRQSRVLRQLTGAFLLPLLFTTAVDYHISLKLAESVRRGEPQHVRKRWMQPSIALNLGLLAFFGTPTSSPSRRWMPAGCLAGLVCRGDGDR